LFYQTYHENVACLPVLYTQYALRSGNREYIGGKAAYIFSGGNSKRVEYQLLLTSFCNSYSFENFCMLCSSVESEVEKKLFRIVFVTFIYY